MATATLQNTAGALSFNGCIISLPVQNTCTRFPNNLLGTK
jgi:hypothetical protein